jgi:hypothetical protein
VRSRLLQERCFEFVLERPHDDEFIMRESAWKFLDADLHVAYLHPWAKSKGRSHCAGFTLDAFSALVYQHIQSHTSLDSFGWCRLYIPHKCSYDH